MAAVVATVGRLERRFEDQVVEMAVAPLEQLLPSLVFRFYADLHVVLASAASHQVDHHRGSSPTGFLDIDAGNLCVSGARKGHDPADSGYPC